MAVFLSSVRKWGTDMSKKRFTKEQIEILSRNENVHKVTDKYIVFEADFKRLCLENVKKGITLRQTFIDCGFDIGVKDRPLWRRKAEKESDDARRNNRFPEKADREA